MILMLKKMTKVFKMKSFGVIFTILVFMLSFENVNAFTMTTYATQNVTTSSGAGTVLKLGFEGDGQYYLVYCADKGKKWPIGAYNTWYCRHYDRKDGEEAVKSIFENMDNQGYSKYSDKGLNYAYQMIGPKTYAYNQERIWGSIGKDVKRTDGGGSSDDDSSSITMNVKNKDIVAGKSTNYEYYVSSTIKINGVPGSSVKLDVEGNDYAFVTQDLKNKTPVREVANGAYVYVVIPFDKVENLEQKITLRATTDVPKSELYLCEHESGNPIIQEIVTYRRGSGSKTISTSLSLKPKLELKFCTPDFDKDSKANCNGTNNLKSYCNHLTVLNKNEKKAEDVTITQTTQISNIITPDNIYDGGGFSLGIMVTNNIKWNYLSGRKPIFHSAIASEINKKLKMLGEYKGGLTINNITLGGEKFNGNLIQKCWPSSNNLNFYGDEGLTTTCIFYFPKPVVELDGKVYYNNLDDGINSKYYVPIGTEGKFDINFDVNGLNRLKDTQIVKDTEKPHRNDTIRWTDESRSDLWNYNYRCSIDVHSLFYKKNRYRFIYRPIDIFDPFPNRKAGINWYDWYKDSGNKDRLENSYKNVEYIAYLNNANIKNIKEYNKHNNYLKWDNIKTNVNGEKTSSYIDGKIIKRVGD